MRQRAARTVRRQEADEHQQEDEPPGEEVSLQVFTNRIHLGRLKVTYLVFELVSAILVVLKEVK